MSDEILDKVIRAITDHLGIESYKVTPNSLLIDDLKVRDELGITEIIMTLEGELNIKIPKEGVENIVFVSDLRDLVSKSMGN